MNAVIVIEELDQLIVAKSSASKLAASLDPETKTGTLAERWEELYYDRATGKRPDKKQGFDGRGRQTTSHTTHT